MQRIEVVFDWEITKSVKNYRRVEGKSLETWAAVGKPGDITRRTPVL